jgi:hypothetical protein
MARCIGSYDSLELLLWGLRLRLFIRWLLLKISIRIWRLQLDVLLHPFCCGAWLMHPQMRAMQLRLSRLEQLLKVSCACVGPVALLAR